MLKILGVTNSPLPSAIKLTVAKIFVDGIPKAFKTILTQDRKVVF